MGDGDDFLTWEVVLGDNVWDVYDCSIQSPTELEVLLRSYEDAKRRTGTCRL